MKKGLLLLFILCLFNIHSVEAKKAKKKQKKDGAYIKGFGWGTCSDVGTLRPYAKYDPHHYNTSSGNVDTAYNGIGRPVAISFLFFGWNNHFIMKLGKEKSVSLNFYPTLGVDIVKNRMINLTLPLMVCYNTGNISSYTSKRDMGWTFGLGAEFIQSGLIKLSEVEEDLIDGSIGYYGTKSNIFQPCANIGMRYFTTGGSAQELNVKFGMHKDDVYDQFGKMPLEDRKDYNNFWVRLSVVHYINY